MIKYILTYPRPSQDLLEDDSKDDYENKIENLGDCNAEPVELQLQEESIAEITNESLRSSGEAIEIDDKN
ncbi:hypothetical protein M0802_015308 [Mischocyttarus mexicanus]|nr:hypothetical protein M0802_015308 [Mischocyttarus mexicanus]